MHAEFVDLLSPNDTNNNLANRKQWNWGESPGPNSTKRDKLIFIMDSETSSQQKLADLYEAEELLENKHHKDYHNKIKWQGSHDMIRLKKKNSVSQSCRPHLFFCAHLILQNSDFHFFCLEIIIFFHFYYEKRRKFAVLEEFKHVGAQKTCKVPFDFWKYGSWNFQSLLVSPIFGFGCAWRQRPIEVKIK